MPKEKRNNLAIYTLAGSILLSSVIVSMNQSNAHSTSATKREFNALKNCIVNFQKDTQELAKSFEDLRDPSDEVIDLLRAYGEGMYMNWISDKLEC